MSDFFKEVEREKQDPGVPIEVELHPREVQWDKHVKRKIIGQQLQDKRISAGLSIDQLAKLSGVNHRVLEHIERGELDESTTQVYSRIAEHAILNSTK